jgi:Cu/Ag efflux protein CusF
MKFASVLILATTLSASTLALAQSKPLPAVMGAEAVTVSATVEAIDLPNRIVTLKAQNGEVTLLKVGPEVKNLAQVKVGDVVTTKYAQAVAVELKKGGSGITSVTEQSASGAAKAGQKPAGVMTNTTVLVANVTAVDMAKKTVSVKGPAGNVLTMAVKDPAVLAQVKVGDQVEATYTEAVMVSVTTPPAKK